MTQMPTGIFARSKRVEAVAMRDNAIWGNPWKPEWRYEVCFAKQLGIGRNGVAENPFANIGDGVARANTKRMEEWCANAGIDVYHIFPSGVGFPNEQDQLLCYLAWR
jgi:hypothetical protein